MAASRNRTPPDLALDAAVAKVVVAAGVSPRDTVCVGFSGGVDSTVLLHVLAGLAEREGFHVEAAHVHHGLSPNADTWRDSCRALAAGLDVPFHSLQVRVDSAHPGGVEAAAREARHRALAGLSCDWLAFGHHQDDQAETLLFRLLRGTGVHGARAMASVGPRVLRPLLGVRRADIVAYAQVHGLSWVEDESNADVRYRRNLLRHEIFPRLEQAFPAAVPALARASEHFREADELLDELAAIDREACGGVPLAAEAALRLTDARLRNLLRREAREAGLAAPTRSRLLEAVRQLREGSGRPLRVSLGDGALCVYRGWLWLERWEEADTRAEILWRGEDVLPWGGGSVILRPAVGEGLARERLLAATEAGLCTRWPGLALRQGAGRPRRTFKNLCQEAGIPEWMRERLPVLKLDGEAAWVGGIGVVAEFRCAPGEAGVVPEWKP